MKTLRFYLDDQAVLRQNGSEGMSYSWKTVA